MSEHVIYEDPKYPWNIIPRPMNARVVCLHETAYYVPENPYTDDDGFLPHDGGGMPEWVKGTVVILRSELETAKFHADDIHPFLFGSVRGYRIVSKAPESGDISGERAGRVVMNEKPWWWPELAAGTGGTKYANTWDHLGDAIEEHEKLADAFLELVDRYGWEDS